MSQEHPPIFSAVSTHTPSRRYRAVHDRVLDYALGAAIIGLNPFPHLFIVTLILVGTLLFKMRHDIQKMWNIPRQKGFWASTDILLGIIAGLSIAFMAWLTVIIISAFLPLVHRFAISAALFALVWMVGFAINHSYLGAYAAHAGETEHG